MKMGKLRPGFLTSGRGGTGRGSKGRIRIGLSVALCLVFLVGQAGAANAHFAIPPDSGLDAAPDVGLPGGNPWNPAWTREPIAQGLLEQASLQTDSNGGLAVAYYDKQAGDLLFARQTRDAVWSVETVDTEGNVGAAASLAFLQDGTPAISYYDNTDLVLKYAVKSGTAWTIRIVDPTRKRGVSTSLAVAPNGKPAIAYTGSDGGVFFASPEGSTWIVQALDTAKTGAVALGFDPQGTPSVVYSRFTTSTQRALQYAQFVAGAWARTTVDSGGAGFGNMPALRFASDGKPRIAYADWSGTFAQWNAKLASLASSEWATQTVATGNVHMISLTLDDQDCPTLFYNTVTPAAFKAARSDCQSWTTQTIESGTRWYPSATSDAQGNPLAAYSELNTPTPGLRLARLGVDPCTLPLGATWNDCSPRTHSGDLTLPRDPADPLRVPHPPIVIEGDASLLAPSSGVTNPLAAGTAEDPYIIEGWSIAAPPATKLAAGAGILVRDTTKHIVIRNVEVSKLDDLYTAGVRLTNASNVRLEDALITGTFVLTVAVTVQGMPLSGGAGVLVDGASHGITIQRNTIENGFTAIEIAGGSHGVLLRGNDISQHRGGGIYAVDAGENVVAMENKITRTYFGLVGHRTVGVRFASNSVSGGYTAVALDNADGALVSGNSLTDNLYGAFLYYSDRGSWTDNQILHNFYAGMALEGSAQTVIAGNVMMDGSQGVWAYPGRLERKPSSANEFRNNDFRGNASLALRLENTPGSVIESNAFCLSSGTAIFLKTSPDTTILRNNFTLYNQGLAASTSSNVSAINNWWGSQGGPGTTGASSVSGAATLAPWLGGPNPAAGSSAAKCLDVDQSPVPVVPEAQPWLIGLVATLITGLAVRRRWTAPAQEVAGS